MNMLAKMIVMFYCLCNWVTTAYKPLLALLSLKNYNNIDRATLLRTFSDLLYVNQPSKYKDKDILHMVRLLFPAISYHLMPVS